MVELALAVIRAEARSAEVGLIGALEAWTTATSTEVVAEVGLETRAFRATARDGCPAFPGMGMIELALGKTQLLPWTSHIRQAAEVPGPSLQRDLRLRQGTQAGW